MKEPRRRGRRKEFDTIFEVRLTTAQHFALNQRADELDVTANALLRSLIDDYIINDTEGTKV